jgi:energy-coupling factor transporter ATP-binding protein EcfA2
MSTEYDAVRHLLTEPRIAARTAAYIGADSFDFVGLERAAETLSGGERLLVRIAEELWSAEKRIGLWELVRRLDRDNFARVLETLSIANGQVAA